MKLDNITFKDLDNYNDLDKNCKLFTNKMHEHMRYTKIPIFKDVLAKIKNLIEKFNKLIVAN